MSDDFMENCAFKEGETWYRRCANCRIVREELSSYGMVNVMVGNRVIAITCGTCIPLVINMIQGLFPKGGLPLIDNTGKEVQVKTYSAIVDGSRCENCGSEDFEHKYQENGPLLCPIKS